MKSSVFYVIAICCLFVSGCEKKIPVVGKREDFDYVSGDTEVDCDLPDVVINSNNNTQKIAWHIKYNMNCSNVIYTKDVLYFVDQSGNLNCFEIKTGKQKWCVKAINAKYISINKENDCLVLLSKNGKLAKFELKTKRIVESFDIKHPVGCQVSLADGYAIVVTLDGLTYAFKDNISNGPIWSRAREVNECVLSKLSAPLIVDKYLYCTYSDGAIDKIDITTGHILWESYINSNNSYMSNFLISQSVASMLNFEKVVIVSSPNDSIICFDKETGINIWNKNIGTSCEIYTNNGWLFVVSQNGNSISCVRVNDGKCKWTKAYGVNLLSVTSFNGKLICSTTKGNILIIDARNGNILSEYNVAFSAIGSDFDENNFYVYTKTSIICIR